MKLIITWQNAVRGRPERDNIEREYRERLIELCGGVDEAAALREDFHRHYEHPLHHWATYNKIAAEEATKTLLPSERRDACFVARFEK